MTNSRHEPFGARFERWVDETPDRVAIAADGRTLTYRETAELARRVTRRVTAGGSEDGRAPIALMMGHGPDTIAAIVGILSAARAYTPLDASAPPARLATVLRLSEARWILTDRARADLAREVAGESIEVLVFEDIAAEPPATPALAPVDSTTLGALLFTSGSTGEPKGVPILHKNIMRGVDTFAEKIEATAQDRFSLITAFSYMPSTYNMLGALTVGASVHPYDMRAHGIDGVLPWLKASHVSVMLMVPTVFRRVAAQVSDPADLSALRHVHLAGEPLMASDVELFRTRFPSTTRLFTEIGSTESGTFAGHYVDADLELQAGVVPTGRAYDDVDVTLKDEQGRDVAEGEPGELYIRAGHIAPGYWRRPDLSEGCFFQDPDDPEVWTYRTGDLAMRREDGCLVTMGRKDDQVKINGIRVEPAEVQAALTGLDEVREAVVLAPADESGERRLIAYVVGEAGRALTPGGLRTAAAQVLPMAMTPSAYVVLDALPTIESGKVDRKALAGLTAANEPAPAADGDIDPETQVFIRGLVGAFESVLKRDGVQGNDDFFLLGGDSIRAVELMSQIEERFNVKLPVSVLLDATTPVQIAERMWSHVRTVSRPGVLRLSGWNASADKLMPLFCLPGAGGHALCYRYFIPALGVENPIYGFEYPGLKGEMEPLETVEELADHFTKLLIETVPSGPVALIGYSIGGTIAFEISRRLNAAGRETPVVAFLDSMAPSAMREIGLSDRAKLFVKYLLDPEQTDKWRVLKTRGAQHLRKKINSLRGQATAPTDLDEENPDTILAAVGDAHIRKVVSACQRAGDNYDGAPFDHPVIQFRSSGPKSPFVSQVDAYSEWNTLSCGGLREVFVPGGHREILRPPAIDVVAETMRELLTPSAEGQGPATGGGGGAAARPQDEAVVTGVIGAFERTLKREGVGPNDDFFLLGGDSLLAVDLMREVNANFDVQLPISVMLQGATPAAIADRVASHAHAAAPTGVVHLSGAPVATGALMPVFCVPGAGGNVLCFRHFIHELSVENPVFGLEYPGIHGRAEPLTTVEALADYFTERVMATAPTGPVALLGYSIGGCITFEMSRRLKAAGREIPMVAFLDSLAPSAMRHLSLTDRAYLFTRYLLDPKQPDKVRMLAARGAAHLRSSIGRLTGKTVRTEMDGENPDALIAAVPDEQIQKVLVACERAGEAFNGTPFSQSVVQFRCGGTQDPVISQLDGYTEWYYLTNGRLREVIVPGGHQDILNPPAIGVVAEKLRAILAMAGPGARAMA